MKNEILNIIEIIELIKFLHKNNSDKFYKIKNDMYKNKTCL